MTPRPLRKVVRPLVGPTVLVSAFVACSSDDGHPPPIPPASYCDTPTCIERVTSAAVAVERTTAPDGGLCGATPLKFSLPEGDDAFRSILECGGNQIRCGSADYRISSSDASFECKMVALDSSVHVHGRMETTNGVRFAVDGDVSAQGGTVTISASAGADGATVEPLECRVAAEPFVAPRSIFAKFDCSPDQDGAACRLRGTFVFENCATTSTDGG